MDNKEFNAVDQVREMIDEVEVKPAIHSKPAGRPRLYKREYIEAQAGKLKEWLDKRGEGLFFLKEYLLESGLTYSQLENFANNNLTYKKQFDRAKTMQEVALCRYGSTKGANVIFCIFALKNLADWNDKRGDTPDEQKTYADKIRALGRKARGRKSAENL